MKKAPREPPVDAHPSAIRGAASSYRSGAVARMLRMPVATLRVWERRYRVTQAALTPSGQRRYSTDDVRRLTLLRQLTELGHAIGNLAGLDMAQLQAVASTHANVLVATRSGQRPARAEAGAPRAWRVAVVGEALASRLQRPAVLRRLGRPIAILGPFADAAAAGDALAHTPGGLAADAVLFHEPHLLGGWRESVLARAPALADLPMAVLFGYAAEAVCDALATAGVALLREPQPDAALAQWLFGLAAAAVTGPIPLPAPETVPPRRWDDAALADFAGLSSTIACECPRHVAELLLQLSRFEAYSVACESRNSADAQLHAYLGAVAAGSRARFERALEAVAMHEGLILPA